MGEYRGEREDVVDDLAEPDHRGRRTTDAGPPAATRSIASFASASAAEFWARGT